MQITVLFTVISVSSGAVYISKVLRIKIMFNGLNFKY